MGRYLTREIAGKNSWRPIVIKLGSLWRSWLHEYKSNVAKVTDKSNKILWGTRILSFIVCSIKDILYKCVNKIGLRHNICLFSGSRPILLFYPRSTFYESNIYRKSYCPKVWFMFIVFIFIDNFNKTNSQIWIY